MLLAKRWQSTGVREADLDWDFGHILMGHGSALTVSAAL